MGTVRKEILGRFAPLPYDAIVRHQLFPFMLFKKNHGTAALLSKEIHCGLQTFFIKEN